MTKEEKIKKLNIARLNINEACDRISENVDQINKSLDHILEMLPEVEKHNPGLIQEMLDILRG